MKIKTLFFLLICIITISISSCDNTKSTKTDSDGLNTTNETTSAPLDNGVINKYNAYVDLSNAISSNVWKAYGAYL